MNKNLLIIGAEQYGAVVKEIAESLNCFEKIDSIDDNKGFAVAKFGDYMNCVSYYRYTNVALDNSEQRLYWIKKLKNADYTVSILIHPLAYGSPSAKIICGTVVEPMAEIQA